MQLAYYTAPMVLLWYLLHPTACVYCTCSSPRLPTTAVRWGTREHILGTRSTLQWGASHPKTGVRKTCIQCIQNPVCNPMAYYRSDTKLIGKKKHDIGELVFFQNLQICEIYEIIEYLYQDTNKVLCHNLWSSTENKISAKVKFHNNVGKKHKSAKCGRCKFRANKNPVSQLSKFWNKIKALR